MTSEEHEDTQSRDAWPRCAALCVFLSVYGLFLAPYHIALGPVSHVQTSGLRIPSKAEAQVENTKEACREERCVVLSDL